MQVVHFLLEVASANTIALKSRPNDSHCIHPTHTFTLLLLFFKRLVERTVLGATPKQSNFEKS